MGLVNTYDQLNAAVAAGTIPKLRAVVVSYYARPSGRMGYGSSSAAKVSSPFFTVDKKAHWSDYGSKSFIAFGDWRKSVEEAKSWASKRFGIKEWARNRMGDYVPAEVNKAHPLPKREKFVK